jgi:hypothetical protein
MAGQDIGCRTTRMVRALGRAGHCECPKASPYPAVTLGHRRWRRRRTEPCRERLTLLGIDHHGLRLAISFLAQVPARGPGEFPVAYDLASIRHAGWAEVVASASTPVRTKRGSSSGTPV